MAKRFKFSLAVGKGFSFAVGFATPFFLYRRIVFRPIPPRRFVLEYNEMGGRVTGVTDDGRLRLKKVSGKFGGFHQPPHSWTFFSKLVYFTYKNLNHNFYRQKDMEVSLAGLVPTPEATAWLRKHILKTKVVLTALRCHGDDLQCEVFKSRGCGLFEVFKNKRCSTVSININEELVKLGLCRVVSKSSGDFDESPDFVITSDFSHELVDELKWKGVGELDNATNDGYHELVDRLQKMENFNYTF